MRRVPLLILPVVLVAMAGSAAGAEGVSAPRIAIAQTLAPPGSPDDGDLAAAQSLLRIERQQENLDPTDPLPGQRYPWRIPRSAVDRPDERTGRLLHFVYVVASNMPDDQFDEKGILEDAARSMNVWTRQQTSPSKQWRLDTFTFHWDDPDTEEIEETPIEAVDVTMFRSSRPSGDLADLSNVDDELISRGLNQPNKRYLIYVASNAGGVCGEAFWTYDPRQDNFDGKYSSVYLYSSSGCRARQFAPSPTQPYFSESIAMQEMLHNDGLVPPGAPNGCGPLGIPFGHVCNPALIATPALDPNYSDVLYPFVGLPLNQKKLDEDNLDYYKTPYPLIRDLENGLYLEDA